MRMSKIRAASAAVLLVSILTGAPKAAHAQVVEEDGSYIAVVDVDQVDIRSGNADTYYLVGTARQGDMVRVVGEKWGWARLSAVGPVFDELFAFVKYPRTDTSRFRLSPDGDSGLTLGLTDVLAPNLDARNDPTHSWKRIDILQPDVRINVLETIHTERDTFHRIPMPRSATLWVSMEMLRPATAEETTLFKRILAGEIQAPRNRPLKPTEADTDASRPAESPAVTPKDETPIEPVATTPQPEQANQPRVIEQRLPEDQPTAAESVKDQPADTRDPEVIARERLKRLEEALVTLRDEPIETAEVHPLRELYVQLAEEFGELKYVAPFARARAEQLQIWSQLQEKRQKIAELRARAEMTAEETQVVKQAVHAAGNYAAVGRLAVSNIYDGRSLPRLLRVQDPGSGRTVAYVEPNEKFNTIGLVGQLIGIVGDRRYDEGLRLTLVDIRRIDLLTPAPDESDGLGP